MEDAWIYILVAVAAIIIGAVLANVLSWFIFQKKKNGASRQADNIIKDANLQAERVKKNAELDAKQIAYETKQAADQEIRDRKREVAEEESKLKVRLAAFDERENQLLKKENALDAKQASLDSSIESYKKRKEELDLKIDDIIKELEKVSGMSTQEAHDEIMARVESKMALEISAYIKNAEDEARETAQARAVDLLVLACQRYAQDVVTERTVSVVALPSDDMKGRIIGREGRNIRVLEQQLGVDLVIDDTPEAITVSCFDPIRRETARRVLEILVKDGRIQPGRIEEVTAKCKKEIDDSCYKYGQEAAFKLGLPRLSRDLLYYVGRLHYRTSYGQNGLAHSMEVAYLAGLMAGELGLDVNLARRAGLLHDIGKSVDFEQEGSHVELGVQLAKRFNEPEVVINAIACHHGDVPATSVIAHLVAAGDTLSAARPGARSETLETYVKRIEALETIAQSYEGVQQAYAMQSGREVRVMVIPEKVSDAEATRLAQQIRENIETNVTYPGQIKVSVIREYRAVETAK
ncbi:MAG: ribonuclease Y [Bacilli bacterium]|nr:ribonuclease Y [Bacilli bacterium]